MLFRSTKWGWKTLAARLLLAPLMTTGVAIPAFAQNPSADTRPKFVPSANGMTDTRPAFAPAASGKTDTRPAFTPATSGKTSTTPTQRPLFAGKKTSDPKELLRMGREALKAGRFDEARALARQADANNTSGRWGLFGDTPESLENDIRSAKAKADRHLADQLAQQAEGLMARAKQVRSETERLAMLDQAYALADRAVILHGPTGFVDNLLSFGTSPEEMKKEIDLNRIALRKKVGGNSFAAKPAHPTQNPMSAGRSPTTVASRTPAKPGQPTKSLPDPVIPVPSGDVVQTGMKAPAAPVSAPNAAHGQAGKLVAEARGLIREGKLPEAKAKASEARKLNTVFAAHEDTPDALMRDIMAAAKTKLDGLVTAAESQVSQKDFAKADASLTEAVTLASSMGFLTRSLEEQRTMVRSAMAKSGTGTAVAVAPQPGIPAGPITVPKLPTANTDAAVKAPKVDPQSVLPPIPDLASNGITIPKIGGQSAQPTKSDVAIAVPTVTPTAPAAPAAPKPTTATAIDVPAVTLPAMPTTPVADASPVPSLPPVTTATPSATGKKLLADATNELRRGDLEMARKLAIEARNGGHGDAVKTEADALLREVDAEAFVRKQKDAKLAFKNAVDSYNAKQYEQALGVLKLLDRNLLPTEMQAKLPTLMNECSTEIAKLQATVKPAATPLPTASTTVAQAGNPASNPAGTQPKSGLADQVKALSEIEFQKFRSDGLDTESKAQAAFNRGETDLAITMLTDFQGRVKGSQLSAARQNLLLGPVERRLETFRIMKRQVDFYAKEAADKKYAKEQIVGRSAADIQKKEEIAKKVRQVNDLVKKRDYRKAEEAALALKSLEPDDPTLAALYELAKRQRRVDEYQKLKDGKEEGFVKALNAAENPGKLLDIDDPVYIDKTATLRALARGKGDEFHVKSLTRVEREIELKLDQPFTVEFQQTPVREVIQKLREQTGLNITTDDAAISDEQISLDLPVTEKVKDLSLRNILAIILDKARLKYVVENDVVRITTEKKAKGRLYTKVFSVMDLVTPIPDFALADHVNFNKAMSRNASQQMPWQAAMSSAMPGALPGGQLVGSGGANTFPVPPGTGMAGGNAVLENSGAQGANPLSASAALAPPRVNTSAQLMKLLTGMVRPYSWQEMGGPGKVDYYDIGGALVVNQTADVIREVQDLLEALRRLQDLSVAVEVRLISLSESFFERVGVDFAMNVKTKQSGRDGSYFERGLTTGQFTPEPFINDINVNNVTVGWNPANGGFTPDLGVPIRPNSFGFGVPPFGGYPGANPNGGLSVGLAFLNDIQVYMFLEAAQGDRRVQVMQAPKITLFNGQTATVTVSEISFFTLGLQVFNVGGQVIYLPQNTPTPTGVSLTVQAVVSADRRFVRLNMTPNLTELTSALVPLFPVTAFITPVFEGGSQGVPIPFTQFFQQPSFQTINVQTTVAVPDGGTVVMGGLKTLSEGRNEFGPPVLSSVPYLNRLFRNQGIGRETRHIMIMVTPRIIINAEEELVQTGVSGGGPAGPAGAGIGAASE
ncbi:MAG: hypothetical protein LC104_21730 [Bacteroidales bacterium]|nr:hypothetical protein [Bacteroidales bacterium]